MADVSILVPQKTKIGEVLLDASVKELHTFEAVVAAHPVEADPANNSMSEVSDSVRPKQRILQIEGVVTDAPMIVAAVARSLAEEDIDSAESAHEELSSYIMDAQTVTIITTLKTYDNMACKSLSVTRDAQKGNALYFTGIFHQITKVKYQQIQIVSAPTFATQKTGHKAAKKTDDASAQVDKTSAADKQFGDRVAAAGARFMDRYREGPR